LFTNILIGTKVGDDFYAPTGMSLWFLLLCSDCNIDITYRPRFTQC